MVSTPVQADRLGYTGATVRNKDLMTSLSTKPAPSSDSLTPQEVVEPALSDEDLSVLPRRGAPRTAGLLGLLCVLAGAGGYVILQRAGGAVGEEAAVSLSASAPLPASAALALPPPPPEVEPEATPLPAPSPELEATPAAEARPAADGSRPARPVAAPTLSAAVEPPDTLAEPPERRAGPSVARFPDLPSRTLSRLAREK